jgi:hypothetical protein
VAWRKGEKLEHYIELAGGYDEGADREAIVVYLEDGKMLEGKKGDARTGAGGLAGSGLAGAIIAAGSVIDVPMKEKVEAVVPASGPQIVEVKGAVKTPKTIAWRNGEKMDYYIKLAGGYGDGADNAKVVVYLADGKVLEAEDAAELAVAVIPVGSIIEVPAK